MTVGLCEQLVEAAKSLHEGGLNVGTAGNLSVREGEGMLITPTGVDYRDLLPGAMVFVGPDGAAEGAMPPSSEWRLHLTIYRDCPHAGAVVHTHSTCATALSCLHRDMPAFHYEVALAGGADIRCARYATYGTEELALTVVEALEGRNACLVANHGLVCHAPELSSAVALARKIEHLAQIYLQCLAAGEPVILDNAEMALVVQKFRDYGRK